MFIGPQGFFFTLFFLFANFLPVIAIAELKSVAKSSAAQYIKKTAEKEGVDLKELNPQFVVPQLIDQYE